MTILLFGGPSKEALVSVASAQNIAKNINSGPLLCWFWAQDGAVYEISKDDLLAHVNAFVRPLLISTTLQDSLSYSCRWPTIEFALDKAVILEVPIFNALHGIGGEDGFIQDECEKRGLKLTGSQSAASKLSFDKEKCKKALANHNINCAPSLLLEGENASFEELQKFWRLHKNIVIKPTRDGSSFGLAFVRSEKEVKNWFDAVKNWSEQSYLAEQFISGTEITVGVLQNGEELAALTPVEICAEQGRVFDYEGKYLGQGVKEIIPARISDNICKQAQEIALKVHKIIGLRGYSRTDLIAQDDGKIYFLEVNSLPGLTKASLVPQELQLAGITMSDFVQSQLKLISSPSGRGLR